MKGSRASGAADVVSAELAAKKTSTAQSYSQRYSVDGRPTHFVSSAIVTARLSVG
jgi:hypothetical protein